MRQSQLPLIGLIIALFFGVRTALPGSQQSSSGSVASNKGEIQKVGKSIPPAQFPPVWEALCKLNPEYASTWYLLNRSKLETTTAKDLDPSCLQGEHEKNLKLDIFSVIAAVPDPVHTHLGLSFDRTIDAIQTAASEADTPYLPYLNALPWPPPQEKSDASGRETVSGYEYPGVLVFRRSESHSHDSPDNRNRAIGPTYLAVFLVPELPTSGIDRPTFLAAVRIMYKISPNSARTIALLGPNFSGSVGLLGALRTQLNAQLKSKSNSGDQSDWCIQAVSGSVTNSSDNPFRDDERCSDCCTSTFTALQTSDHDANTSFIRAMRSSGYCPGEIAILTEDGTEFGEYGKYETSPPPSGKSKHDSCEHKKSPLSLHFPREISKLRNAYGPSITQQSQKEKTQAASSPALSLNWQDAHPFIRDDVRNYGEQTAVSEETVLASLATTIKSQRIKALGILATDPLDTAFLIHSFRTSSPDVRLFLRDPDLLYLRTPDLGSTNGIMVINNFPLVPQNQFWREDGQDDVNHLILLPSAQQEAAHSAFVLLLKYKLWHPPLRVLPPQTMFKPLDGEWPAEPSRSVEAWMGDKPLWLGVTGTAGYYPVRVLNENAPAHEQVAALHSLKIGRPPYATMLLLVCIALVGIFHASWATFPTTVPARFDEEFDFSNKADTIIVAKGFCHALALLSLCLGCLLVGSSFFFFRHTAYSVSRIPVYKSGAILALGVTITLVLAAAWRLFDSVLRPWRAFKRETSFSNCGVIRMGTLVRSTPLAVAIFVAPIVYWLVATSKSTYENAFLHYRNLYLASGVAPALPGLLLVAIAYLGILAYLRRITYWEYGSVKTPALPLDDTFPSDFSANVDSIDAWMLGIPAASKKRVFLFLLFFTASVLALRPWATMDTLEGVWVRWFLAAGFTFSFFIISVNWIRFTAIWRQLRTILRGLEKLPLRLAFGRLPRESSLPIWSWSIHDGTFLPIVQAVDTLRALLRADPGAITPESEKQLKSGILAISSPGQWQTLQELEQERERSMAAETQALNFIVQERERVVSFQETPTAFAMTADGTMPVPLRRTEPSRTPTSGPNMGNVIEIRLASSDARATGASAKMTSIQQKQIMHETRRAMSEVIKELSETLVREYWNRGGVGLRTEAIKTDPADRKYLLAEDLVALRFYSYIRYVVSELRNLMFLLALSFSLLYLSLQVYSFRAGQAIEWSFIVLFLVMGGGVFWVLLQMERDALLSRLEGTTAGQLNKQFYINLLKYGVVPLLTVFGSHVPAVSNFLLTKLQPTLEVFR